MRWVCNAELKLTIRGEKLSVRHEKFVVRDAVNRGEEDANKLRREVSIERHMCDSITAKD